MIYAVYSVRNMIASKRKQLAIAISQYKAVQVGDEEKVLQLQRSDGPETFLQNLIHFFISEN